MAYNVLGINPFHNGSVCVLSDEQVVYYLEEDRKTRYKYDFLPFKLILEIFNKYKIDEVVIAGINYNSVYLSYSNKNLLEEFFRKIKPNLKITLVHDHHHLTHIYHAFYNSGFESALGIVIDSGGSGYYIQDKHYTELDSIYHIDLGKVSPFRRINTNSSCYPLIPNKGIPVARAYTLITSILGFNVHEEGKVMGLSSYGKLDKNIPKLYDNFLTNPNYIPQRKNQNPYGSLNSEIYQPQTNNKWHKDSNLITPKEKNLAWRIQKDSQELVKNYIIKYIKETGLTQVVCSGGYFLNCVSNYYLTKSLPNINFYFEPIAHDGGTAIGATYMIAQKNNNRFKPKKQKSLYYGPKYPLKKTLKTLKKYVSN